MVESDGTLLGSYFNYPAVRTTGYSPVQASWRWYDDASSITPTSPLAAEDTAPIDVSNENEIKLRTSIHEVEGASGSNVDFGIQYSEYADFGDGGSWITASSSCQANSTWCYVDGAGVDGALIDAKVLSDSDACTGGSGNGCGQHNEGTTTISTLTQPASSHMEFEFTIKSAGPRVNSVYYFRVYDIANDEAVFASSSYPSLVTEGASLTFTLSGIAASQSVEGITTDIPTTATSIGFGSLPIGSEFEAAQTVGISTNATEGYQILMYGTGDLLNSYGEAIDPITGTNAAPIAWAAGCSISATGCFGYHSGDDTLSAGSARFSASDTYAQFSTTTAEEVVYSSIPVIAESTDVVYKLQVNDLQEAGQYETGITYIAMPVF